MKRVTLYVCTFLAAFAVWSCDEGVQPSSVNDVQEVVHPVSGNEPLEDAKLGFFYENDYIAPMFNPFKTKEQFDEIAKNERAKYLHVVADSTNTVDIVNAKAEWEDLSLKQRIKAKSDLRYQMIYINTYPTDAKFTFTNVESSNEDVVNPIKINDKTWFMELVRTGQANLTMTVSDGKKTIIHEYPVTVIAEVPLFFSCDNIWVYGRKDVPVQRILLKYAFPKLPKEMDNLDFWGTCEVKLFRQVTYRDEPNYGNKIFHIEDTVRYKQSHYVEALKSEEEKGFLALWGDKFNPYYEWDRYYEYYFDSVKMEKVPKLVERKVPYDIYRVALYYDATPFNPFFDMDGDVGKTTFCTFTAYGEKVDVDDPEFSAQIGYLNGDYSYVQQYYRAMGNLWTPKEAERSILELYFNEFLSDAQIDSLRNSMAAQYYSHGWTDAQVDSIFNANKAWLDGYKRDK